MDRQHVKRAWIAAGAVVLFMPTASCDPSQDPPVWQDGPAFLTVARAARQPATPDLGVTVYVQGRGGNLVGITTRGGTHRYADLAKPVTTSCAGLPGSRAFYLMVAPDAEEATVEARLYNVCAPLDGLDSSDSFDPCEIAGIPVITTLVPIRRSNAPADAGDTDGAEEPGVSSSLSRSGGRSS